MAYTDFEKTEIDIFLYEKLPHERILKGCSDPNESPLENVEELCGLYETKYGQFGDITFHILREDDSAMFVDALNRIFEANNYDTKVNPALVYLMADKFLPLIVVNGEIISKAVYPDLTMLRGGDNSVSRGGSGEHHH